MGLHDLETIKVDVDFERGGKKEPQPNNAFHDTVQVTLVFPQRGDTIGSATLEQYCGGVKRK